MRYQRSWLLKERTGRIQNFYDLYRDGEDFSVKVCASEEHPSQNPITMEGELRVSAKSIRKAVEDAGVKFDEDEVLSIYRPEKNIPKDPLLPGHDYTDADLPYDPPSRKFAIILDDFGTWNGSLTKYNVPIDGRIRMKWSVSPDRFSFLKERALSGRPVVISPEDFVSSLSDPLGVPFADHVSPPNRVEAQLAIGDAADWASSNWNMCVRGWSTGRWTLQMSLSVVYVIHHRR